jgi:Raf kinase inhibitor-like YbhB/YbcL family protein
MLELTVLSAAFLMNAAIPAKYTCNGQNISPPLSWSAVPTNTQTVAVLCDDPDAPVGDWVHWVIFNIPATTNVLPEAVPAKPQLPSGAIQGMNDFGNIGYDGPCPPPGKPHRYFFKVFALDTKLILTPKATKRDLLKAMKGHILAKGELIGTFTR